MEISKAYQQDISSLRNALSVLTLRQLLNQDGTTVIKLLEGLEDFNGEMQRYREGHLGNHVDILV